MSKSSMVKFLTRITQKQDEKLEKYVENGYTKANILRVALNEWMAKHPLRE
ncbi:MAG: hypothetical protein KGH64_04640 [Candidatus Micrarchaeota archaeon]|nr:hypothetical protein [Candidatus Micrarchaeota archaeon]MDE1834600.1 hypothetical protein [Candidatus Micrarchaeota archaeon]MDE1859201.1 hypothetical protein [Candidatus Micrarchaeota archaeon]